MPFCQSCGAEVAKGARFCEECGAALVSTPISAASQTTQPVAPDSYQPTVPSQPIAYYAAPSEKPTGVTLIGILQIVMGGLSAFLGFYAFSAGSDVWAQALAPEEAAALRLLGMIFFSYGICAIVFAALLLQMKNSGRIGTLVIQGIFCLWIPIGTVIGAVCIWYLGFRAEIKQAFHSRNKYPQQISQRY